MRGVERYPANNEPVEVFWEEVPEAAMGLVLFSTFNNDLEGGKHIKITDYPKLTGGVNTNEGKQRI